VKREGGPGLSGYSEKRKDNKIFATSLRGVKVEQTRAGRGERWIGK